VPAGALLLLAFSPQLTTGRVSLLQNVSYKPELDDGDCLTAKAAGWGLGSQQSPPAHHELTFLMYAPKPLVVLQVMGGDKLGTEAPPYIDVDTPLQRLAEQENAPKNGTCVLLGDDWELGLNASLSAQRWLGCSVVNRLQPGYTHFQAIFTSSRRRCAAFGLAACLWI
jgi:hypothetical protein